MVLKDVLQHHNIPLPDDYDERFDILISGLKRDGKYEEKLKAFRRQTAGQEMPKVKMEREDFLGPRLRWFVDAMGSPYAQTVVRTLFMVLFFISYLEAIPTFGSILSAVLDLMVAGGKALTKTIQKIIPPTIGLIPLPYMNFVGMGVAALFGFFVWPVVALVSFSRQDFTAAIDSYVRIIPPPIGDMIGDNFLEVNRTVARLDVKRQKLVNDITTALTALASASKDASTQVSEGATKLASKTQEALVDTASKISTASAKATELAKKQPEFVSFDKPLVPASQIETAQKFGDSVSKAVTESTAKLPELAKEKIAFEPTQVRKGGKKLSRRARGKHKWKTLRNKYVKH